MVERVYNFSPGPAALPLAVLREAQEHLMAMPGAGASVMEISHRSAAFGEILETAKSNLKSLLKIPDSHRILFLQGGASMQFAMAPMNFLGAGQSADYILTGSWGSKAIKEAEKIGKANRAWDGKPDNYKRVPKRDELNLDPNAAYLHFTSNETIQGVEFFEEPEANGVPLICDASSDILSRPIPVEKYALLYAGAQKNAGPAGVTIAIVREDMLEKSAGNLPSMLDYKVMAENDSLYNTPPCFSIYIVMLTTKWLIGEIGGLETMRRVNKEKAALLYDAIDNSGGYYKGHAEPSSRSVMNVTWRLPTGELEKKFIEEAKRENLAELKGHRSVGGLRASIYNAMPVEGVKKLAGFMTEFMKNNPV